MTDKRTAVQPPVSPAPQPAPSAGKAHPSPDRRDGDRRTSVVDRRVGLDRRRGPGRRRSDERRAAEEGEMTAEQFEFLLAIDRYKRLNHRPFPSWTEVLDVIHALGYRKVAEPGQLR
jgi:hypothetical protein